MNSENAPSITRGAEVLAGQLAVHGGESYRRRSITIDPNSSAR